MLIIFGILIILACVLLGFFVLIQNPKGGGLAGTIAGFNSQFMGVKQTTDVLEKGTWIMAAVIALLCLSSAFFIPKERTTGKELNARPVQSAPAAPNASPLQTTPAK